MARRHISVMLPLPPPPSRMPNNVWRVVTGRGREDARYQAWLDEAGWILRRQMPFVDVAPPLSVEIALTPPGRRGRAIDCHVKSILALCRRQNLMRVDADVHRLLAYWCRDIDDGARVEIVAI
jgi:Holliday junction resolvase RusA-like endonuclease